MPSSSMLQVAYSKDRNMQLSTIRTSSYPGLNCCFFSTRFTDSKKNLQPMAVSFQSDSIRQENDVFRGGHRFLLKIRISEPRSEEWKFPRFFLLFFPGFPITFEKDTKWFLSIDFWRSLLFAVVFPSPLYFISELLVRTIFVFILKSFEVNPQSLSLRNPTFKSKTTHANTTPKSEVLLGALATWQVGWKFAGLKATDGHISAYPLNPTYLDATIWTSWTIYV